ncbi:MAG: hypothetical protein ABJC13_05805 [Acidobacteriota bacterium]
MRRLGAALAGLFLACWVVVLLGELDVVDLAGHLPLGLYPLYSLAVSLGWGAGIAYSRLRRKVEPRRRFAWFLVCVLGPLGLVFLLRAMAPAAEQEAAPLVPYLAFGVFSVFFLMPAILPGPWSR